MSKRLGFVLVVMLIVPLLLSACGAESKDTAEDYMNAILKGDEDKALELACESFKDETSALVAFFGGGFPFFDEESIDLKYDVGKGNNANEIIVTGAFNYGIDPDDPTTRNDPPREYIISGGEGTLIILWLDEDDGDWCVNDSTEFGGIELAAAPADGAADEAAEDAGEEATDGESEEEAD
jgi:hypothetical protein